MTSTFYNRFPHTQITDDNKDCASGWRTIGERLQSDPRIKKTCVIAVECYPGTDINDIAMSLSHILEHSSVVRMEEALLSEQQLLEKFALGDDPVFAMLSTGTLRDMFDAERLCAVKQQIAANTSGRVLVVGTGAILAAPSADVVFYADIARWEIQARQRAHEIGNLGLNNHEAAPAQLYKRAFFLDWRLADRLKRELLPTIDYFLDVNDRQIPKMLSGELFRSSLGKVVRQPFRVVPFFDPGPWGGHWMKARFQLPENGSNYAWCFDCVPEENSLLLGFGEQRVEVPSLDVVLLYPSRLLGDEVYRRFGAEFPIRFDYLDTMGGGNLSLQVHPLREYIRNKFGMDYTQDESYYMFEAAPDCTVYLGFKDGIDRVECEADLRSAQDNGAGLDVGKYVNVWPAKRHDHFLIPAGTIHCSGRDGVVLEISATPYIFTFKLWDWERLGLDGKPRPVHLEHGFANLQWERTTNWVRSNLINRIDLLRTGDGWREERTGLHEFEFIETRRHWFHSVTPHDTAGTVNVLNLIEGEAAIVESPSGAFAPYTVHYGETFIVPASVGEYTIRPDEEGAFCATIKAFVRSNYAV